MSAARASPPSCCAGALAGLSGYLWVSRYAVAYVDIAGGFELDIIAACVIGGISIAGGIGSVAGAVLGALFLGVIKNALPVVNISPFWQLAISGTAIIIAVAVNARAEGSARPHHPAARRRRCMTHLKPTPARHPRPAAKAAWRALLKSWESAARRRGDAVFVDQLASPRPISSTPGTSPTPPSTSPRRR